MLECYKMKASELCFYDEILISLRRAQVVPETEGRKIATKRYFFLKKRNKPTEPAPPLCCPSSAPHSNLLLFEAFSKEA